MAAAVYTEERQPKSTFWVASAFHVLLATIILAFAAILRISQLNSASLWFDDAWVALVARMSASQFAQIGMTSFGFDAILWTWFKLVGFSEISAKFVPFAIGCLTPVAVYAMVIRKGLGWIPGIIAALILVVAPADVQYAATVKQYTTEGFLTVLLVWLAWNVLEDPRRKNVIWLGAAACLSVIVSSMTVFVAAPAVCIPTAWTALKYRERRLDSIIVAMVTLAFIGIWLPLMAIDAASPALRSYWSNYYVVRANGISGIASSSLSLAGHFVAGLTHRRFPWVAISAVIATILVVRRRPLLTGILWFPIVFVYLASFIGRAPFGGGRTDIFLHPLVAVLLALAAYEMLRLIKEILPGKTWRAYVGPVAAAAVIIFIVRGAHAAFPNHPDEDLRPLVRHLLEQKQKGDVVVVYPPARYEWFLYSNEPFSIAPRGKHPVAFPYTMEANDTVVLDEYPEDSSAYVSEIDRAIGANRIWLVASHLGYLSHPGPETRTIEMRFKNKGYRLESKEERSRAFVELWTRPAPQASKGLNHNP